MICKGSIRTSTRGSVLVPLVAAMLIMLMTGVALTELFGAQRMQSVLEVESTQAFWIAEAGLAHAAYEGTNITPAVTFAGGTYSVTKSGDDFVATAARGNATRVVTRTITATGIRILDADASVATLAVVSTKIFSLDLVSLSATDLEIESFDLTPTPSTEQGHGLTLEGKRIWHEHDGWPMPTGLVTLTEGSSSDRTIPAGGSPSLEYESATEPSGSVDYTLILNFTDASSDTLSFTVVW